ncbi:MAG: D-sedoheptulose 7-phosphate isomerase [Bacteroidetes bacterium]|jgi:D-sedoheptulose 7-phosphate isomerase|nr:D-sedoheptulose 7-phosphate isomerase [Bacteroidota bacterium]
MTAAETFEEAARVLHAFVQAGQLAQVEAATERMSQCLQAGGKLMSCGNGGSMCDAMHFAEELSGRFRQDRPGLAALAISDPSHLSCVGNDYGYEQVFSRYVEALGQAGDVLLAISTSGNSANVVRAAQAARAKGIAVIGLTGKDGGQLAPLCNIEIRVPHQGYADRVQEVHIKVIHCFIQGIEQRLGFSA